MRRVRLLEERPLNCEGGLRADEGGELHRPSRGVEASLEAFFKFDVSDGTEFEGCLRRELRFQDLPVQMFEAPPLRHL